MFARQGTPAQPNRVVTAATIGGAAVRRKMEPGAGQVPPGHPVRAGTSDPLQRRSPPAVPSRLAGDGRAAGGHSAPVSPADPGRRRLRDDAATVPYLLRASAAWSWRLLILTAAVVAVGYLASRLKVVFVPVLAALLLTALLRPLVDALGRVRVPRLAATWLVLLALLGVLAGVATLFGLSAGDQLANLGAKVNTGVDRVRGYLTDGPFHFSRQDVENTVDSVRRQLGQNRGQLVSGALSGASLAVELVAGVLLTLFTTFFFLYDGERIWRWVASRFPDRTERRVRGAGAEAWRTITGYIRGTVLVALVDATGIGLALLVIGVPLVVPLALLTFLGGFIPIVGATVAGAAAVLVALVTKGPAAALVILGAVIAVQQLEGHVLQPFVLGRTVHLHPLAIVLSLTAGGVLAGIPGAIVAVPLVAVLNRVASYLAHHPAEPGKPAVPLTIDGEVHLDASRPRSTP